MNVNYDIIIIGAGCAGMTAAIYARRAGKSVLLLESDTFGGQIAFSPKVENYPAVPSSSGEDLANKMFEQAMAFGAAAELEKVLEVSSDGEIKKVRTDYGEYTCLAIIIAAGMKHRCMGLENESDFLGKGVSYCAVCDGAFYKDRDVAVLGGGDTALCDALFLSEICKSVTVIHRRNEFRGEKWLLETLKKRNNIRFLLENVVIGLAGGKELESLLLKNTVTGEESRISADALFVAIGQIPQTEIFKDIVNLSEDGFISADESCTTSAEGIFVAGDCRTKQVRQLATAAADGAVAALAACKYIDRNKT